MDVRGNVCSYVANGGSYVANGGSYVANGVRTWQMGVRTWQMGCPGGVSLSNAMPRFDWQRTISSCVGTLDQLLNEIQVRCVISSNDVMTRRDRQTTSNILCLWRNRQLHDCM